jgi:hypothetical protein
MKIQEYITSATRPSVYTPGSAAMWSDEHISRQLLEVHLNPDIDLASRKPETIDATIDWILSLRIPLISATHSSGSRPAIPRDPGHPFQRIAAG